MLLLTLLLLIMPVTAQDAQSITVPSFDVTVADSTSESGDKPYGMLIDVPEEVELATIVINGIALDLTGGTVILWRDDIITDTNTVGAGEDDFDTNRRPASWSLSVTKGLVKMRVVDPELAEELGDQEIVVTEGAGVSYDEEAVAQGQQVFDIEPFKEEDIDELQSVVSAVDEDAELKVLTEAQVQVVEDSQELLNSIDDLNDVQTASDIILDNASDDTAEDSFFEFDEVESDTLGFDDNNLIQFLIENGDLTPEQLGELALTNPEIGNLIMNSMLFEEDSIESLSALAATNPEMFDFFVDIVAYDDRAVDYFMEISAGNEAFVDEWDLYIAEDPAFADAFVGRFNDPAASYALSGLAGESLYINELMLDMAIYDPAFADELAYVWDTNPDSAQFFFDTVMFDDDALLDAQFIFANNIDAFDPIVDGWASDPTLGFSDFYDDFGADALFTGYEIDYFFGASIVSCTPLGNGSTDIEVAFINEPIGVSEIELFGNGSRTVSYESYLFLNVRDSILPIFSIDAYDANGNFLETAFINQDACFGGGQGGGEFYDPFFDDSFDDLYYDEFSDPAQFGGSSFAETGLFGLEVIGCYPDGFGSTIVDMSVYNVPAGAQDFYLYSLSQVQILPADGFVSITVDDNELPLSFAEAYSGDGTYLDFAFLEGIPCDSSGGAGDPFADPAGGFDDPFAEGGSGFFTVDAVDCTPLDDFYSTVTFSVSGIPEGALGLYFYSPSYGDFSNADGFVSLTYYTQEVGQIAVDAYDNEATLDTTFISFNPCDGSGGFEDDPFAEPAGGQGEGVFTAEIIECSTLDSSSTSVTLLLSNVPDIATDMVIYTQTGSLSVFPSTTTFVTINNTELPITYVELGNGVDVYDGNTPTGLFCDGGGSQGESTDSDFDGYTDDVDSCPLNGDNGNGVDEFGCPVVDGSIDSDFDGYTDDVDFCPFEGDNGNGVDEFGCPIGGSTDSDFDGYTDDVDSCPFEGDNGNGVDEFGCPIGGSTDSDFDRYTDDVDSCPFDGDNGSGVDEFGCPIASADSDFDGYTDDVDSCPLNGDNGYGVDEFGCPNPAPDSDFDGYTDDVDSCPLNGDNGYGVDEFGCPNPAPDSDGDGYTDDVDSCPAEGDAGAGVDSFGCPNSVDFAVAITGCQSNGDGTTTVTFALSNIPAEAAFILFYDQSGGTSGGVQSSVQITTPDNELPFVRVDVERNTSPFLITDAVPTGSCP